MKMTYFAAADRGSAEYGWLKTSYSFSFANYYNPARMGFGALRVLNDDWIDGESGFGFHPHDNMEIITIFFSGALTHEDSMGKRGVIRAGDVQTMSVGTGVLHAEMHTAQEPVTLFQIWIMTRDRRIAPYYDQRTLTPAPAGQWQTIVAPDTARSEFPDAAVIHQDAWISRVQADGAATYESHDATNGIFVMMIEGSARVGEQKLNVRDALEITGAQKVDFTDAVAADILVIEVPMI